MLLVLILLWVQLFVALIPTWRSGEYYSYGWFVPLLAAGLAWRRWKLLAPATDPAATSPGMPGLPMALFLLLAFAAIIPLRLIGTADPGWRPPLLLHVVLVFGITHLWLWQRCGRGISLGLLPATIFALSAVPYPWQIEQHLIRSLTGLVLSITREAFLLVGQPVELLGERLALGTDVVEVTDGCSGIRSFQSLVMVALFFGELFFLPLGRRIALIALAGLSAVAFNTLRAWWLAHVHFAGGPEAAAAAHDRIGHTTFILSAATLWLSAYGLLHLGSRGPKVLRRTLVVGKS
jgi:exosortase